MARQLILLKLKMTWNTIRRQTALLVLTILGFVYFLSIIGALAAGVLVAAATGGPSEHQLIADISVIVGAAFVLGWLIAPFIFASVDNTLDPRALMTVVPPSRRLANGLLAATGVGVPGILSGLVLLIPTAAWAVAGHPVVAIGAFVAAALSLATCFALTRAASTWFTVRVDRSAKRRDLIATLGTVIFIVAVAPLGMWISTFAEHFSLDVFTRVSHVIAWTPVGAAWGVPRALLDGQWGVAAGQLGIATLTFVLGLLAWHAVLPSAMSGTARPVTARAEEAIREGRHLVDPTLADPQRTSGAHRGRSGAAGTGATRWLASADLWRTLRLSGPAAALAARTTRDWLHDARLSATLVMPLLFSLLGTFQAKTVGVGALYFFLVFPATLTGLMVAYLPAYDSTALWVLIASGIRGKEERLGRLAGSLPLLLPLLLVPTGIAAWYVGSTAAETAALVALVLVVFCASTGLGLIACARWLSPVQPPGTSPLSTKGTGQWSLTMLLQFGVMIGSFVVAAPAIVAVILALVTTWMPIGAAVAIAVVWSLLCLTVGTLVGGRVWDRHDIDLLTTIRSWPGH